MKFPIMKSRLMFVESYTGGNHNGPAWIGRGYFSKSGKTMYFDGKSISIHGYEIGTGDRYWISGVKKNGQDRHKYGPATLKVMIDETVVEEYLHFRGLDKLPPLYEVIKLNNAIDIEEFTIMENHTYHERQEWLSQHEQQ